MDTRSRDCTCDCRCMSRMYERVHTHLTSGDPSAVRCMDDASGLNTKQLQEMYRMGVSVGLWKGVGMDQFLVECCDDETIVRNWRTLAACDCCARHRRGRPAPPPEAQIASKSKTHSCSAEVGAPAAPPAARAAVAPACGAVPGTTQSGISL